MGSVVGSHDHSRPRRGRAAYLADLLDELEALDASPNTKGGLYIATIAHDDWCALLHNHGPCNCNPVVLAPERVEVTL